jgi:hypothetical protein
MTEIKVHRVSAPSLPCSGDAVTVILELTAAHLRRSIPILAGLSATDFDVALGDLRRPIQQLLDEEIHEALTEELMMREKGGG